MDKLLPNLLMKVITKHFNFLTVIGIFLFSQIATAQIVSDGLNNPSSHFTVSGGAFYTLNSATGDRPASSPFFSEGAAGYGVTNATATLTSAADLNTTGYTGIAMSFRLAAFSVTNSTNGLDGTDLVTVAISPDGGTNWYNTVTVAGNANAFWAYSTGTGIASTAYDGNTSAVAFAPTGGANRTTDGYSTVTVTNLPAVTNLRVRITLLNNATTERWVVDDFKITGTVASTSEINLQGNSVNISSADLTPGLADHTDFGSVAVASGTLTRTFTIQNTGAGSLTVGAISFSGTGAADYTVSTAPVSPVLSGGSQTFVVTFDPSVAGARNATISIVNNDSDENPYTFGLTGTGLADTNVADYVNLLSPATATITEGGTVSVFAQVGEAGLTENPGQGVNISGWIGYSATNSNPNGGGWTWVAATYLADDVSFTYDEYGADLGAGLVAGTYYYASRFQIGAGPYAYGGLGGTWNNDSGVLTVNGDVVDLANVSPATATIVQGSALTVLAQVYEPGVTPAAGQGAGISGQVGYSASNTNPSTAGWTWVAATFNAQVGQNDQYQAAIGAALAPGTYYYASRFKKTASTQYVYGGTAGIWNNDSGVLTVNTAQEINVQGNATSIVDGDITPDIADHTDFGTVALGGNIVRTFTIQNTGGTNLVLDATAVLLNETDSFTIIQQPTSPVTPGGSTTFQVQFTPTTTTADTNTVLIGSNDANEGTYSFDVRGAASIGAPTANAATNITQTSFDANWTTVPGATSYRLDVATDPSFVGAFESVVAWNFPNSPDNEVADGGIAANSSKTLVGLGGVSALNFTAAGASSNSANATLWNSGSGSKYWEVEFATTGHYGIRVSSKQRSSSTGPRDFKLQYKIGAGGTYADVTGGTVITANNYTTGVISNLALPAGCDNQSSVYLRWIMTSNTTVGNGTVPTTGSSNIDDILIEGQPATFVSGYNDLNVGNVLTYTVDTNLTQNTTYYYRVRAFNGSASISSNPITVTTQPTSVTWNGSAWSNVTGPTATIEAVIAGVYNSGTNGIFTAKKLTIDSGSFTIADATTVTVVNEVINNLTDADFVIESNGNLIQNNDVNNTGNATVNRDTKGLKRLDYVLWSSPVVGQNLLDFSPDTILTRFYVYNSGTNEYNSVVPSTTPFAEGSGYLIRMPDNHPTVATVWNGVFKGELHNGNVSVPVTTGTYNAVGNPYPSTIDADAFITANGLTQPLYFWRKTNGAATTAYATYTFAGGTSTEAGPGDPNAVVPNGIIQVGQGFIAQATSNALVFNNQMRVTNDEDQFFRNSLLERSRIWLNLTNAQGLFSQSMVAYMEGATQGVDAAIDGLYFNDSQVALTSLIGTAEYAIQGRALPFDNTDVVPMGFKAINAGTYAIALDHADGLFADATQDIYLKDNVAGITHDLRTGAYTFAAEAGVSNSRFEVVYQTTLGVSNPLWDANQVVVYTQSRDVVVNTGAVTMDKVELYDLTGRLIASKKGINASEVKIFAGVASQVLIVKITSVENGVVTKKVTR